MEIPKELFELYNKLIDTMYSDKESYGEQELSTFTPGVGKDYKNKLMIVGRAVNGWGDIWTKQIINIGIQQKPK